MHATQAKIGRLADFKPNWPILKSARVAIWPVAYTPGASPRRYSLGVHPVIALNARLNGPKD